MWKSAYVGVYQVLNWNMHGETLKFEISWQCFRVVLHNCLQCQGHIHCILLFIMLPELIVRNNYPALLFWLLLFCASGRTDGYDHCSCVLRTFRIAGKWCSFITGLKPSLIITLFGIPFVDFNFFNTVPVSFYCTFAHLI